MIDIAMPAEYFLEVPASAYVMGIMDAVPKPTNENPAIANQNFGKITAIPIPDTTQTELNRYVAFMPIRVIIISDKNLERAIKNIKIRYP